MFPLSPLRHLRDDIRAYLQRGQRVVQANHDLPGRLVVSLTSHPPRYRLLHHVISSLLNQTTRPDDVILWVEPEEKRKLPGRVVKLQRHGLRIVECETGLRSYKKIIPALKRYPDAFIVTADDDAIYPPHWLRGLVDASKPNYNNVTFHRGMLVTYGDDGLPLRYLEWRRTDLPADPNAELVAVGLGGVLYPPGSLAAEVTRRDLFLDLAPTSDDLWLHWMARKAGTLSRRTANPVVPLSLPTSDSDPLFRANIAGGGNDATMRRLADV